MTTTNIMIELHSGYGDGYGVVAVDAGGKVETNPARKVTHYTDGTRMEAWRAAILSAPSIDLIDGGVRVPPSAIKRVIGPLDGPEASRIRARRYTKNWQDAKFVELASDEEIVAAMGHNIETDTYAACGQLRAKYAAK